MAAGMQALWPAVLQSTICGYGDVLSGCHGMSCVSWSCDDVLKVSELRMVQFSKRSGEM